MVDAAISESVFNMLEGCVPEFTEQGYDRPPSGSTISGELPWQTEDTISITGNSARLDMPDHLAASRLSLSVQLYALKTCSCFRFPLAPPGAISQ